MKRVLTSLLVTAVMICMPFTFTSCDKIKGLIDPFDIFLKSKDIPITIPVSAAGHQQAFASIDFDIMAEIEKQNTSGFKVKPENIEFAKINKVSIEIVGGANQQNNFANFIGATVLFGSNATTSTQNKLTIADIPTIPDVYSTNLDMNIFGTTDLKEYLHGTRFEYLYAYELRRPITTPLQAVIHVEYDIKINP